MKIDITELLIVFDELLTSVTNEEIGVYWFRSVRSDGLIVPLSFSIYENYVGVLIHNNLNISVADVNMKNCSEIRVLDRGKKQLEIIHENLLGRCFLSLMGENILNYEE